MTDDRERAEHDDLNAIIAMREAVREARLEVLKEVRAKWTPTPPIRRTIRRKSRSVTPAIGARMSGGSTSIAPSFNITLEFYRTWLLGQRMTRTRNLQPGENRSRCIVYQVEWTIWRNIGSP